MTLQWGRASALLPGFCPASPAAGKRRGSSRAGSRLRLDTPSGSSAAGQKPRPHKVRNSVRSVIAGFVFLTGLSAQEINIYSEFERFDPFGQPVVQDRDMQPRELLSPAVPRNGHLSVHVVVTAPAGTNYFLYAASNPDGIVGIKLYREHFVKCGDDYCPDWLTEQRSPSFGAIPESALDNPDQTTRCYLLDIYVPPDVFPRRVRIEALLKVGTWLVAPMEMRVIGPTVPDTRGLPVQEDIAAVGARSSDTAQRQLLQFLDGLAPELPPGIVRARDVIQRNAAEDMLLARALGIRAPELNFMAWTPWMYPDIGGEWYLRVRDFIYRYNQF